MVDANILEDWKFLMTTCQFKNSRLHVRKSWIQGTHLEALIIDRFAGMDSTRIDENHAAGRCKVFGILMGKRLEPSFDHTDHIVFMKMARIGVLNVGSL